MSLPAKQEQQIVFRRIKGRVVAIRTSMTQNRREAIEGLSFLGAGVATALASGSVYRNVNRAATQTSARAFRSLERLSGSIMFEGSKSYAAGKSKSYSTILKALNRAKNISKSARPLRVGGQLVSSALIGIGASNLHKATTDRDANSDFSEEVGSSVAAGAFLVGTHGKVGMRTAIKPLYVKAYPALRKLKGLLKL